MGGLAATVGCLAITLKAKVTFTPVGGSPYSEYVPIPVGIKARRSG